MLPSRSSTLPKSGILSVPSASLPTLQKSMLPPLVVQKLHPRDTDDTLAWKKVVISAALATTGRTRRWRFGKGPSCPPSISVRCRLLRFELHGGVSSLLPAAAGGSLEQLGLAWQLLLPSRCWCMLASHAPSVFFFFPRRRSAASMRCLRRSSIPSGVTSVGGPVAATVTLNPGVWATSKTLATCAVPSSVAGILASPPRTTSAARVRARCACGRRAARVPCPYTCLTDSGESLPRRALTRTH